MSPKTEIVGIRIKTDTSDAIWMGIDAIMAAKYHGNFYDLVTREVAKLMDSFDLGPSWTKLANSPTLFTVDDDGNFGDFIWECTQDS
jgi:hypothetical protein